MRRSSVQRSLEGGEELLLVGVTVGRELIERNHGEWLGKRRDRTARALQKGINVVMCTHDERALAERYMHLLQIQGSNLRVMQVDHNTTRDAAFDKFVKEAQL